MNDVKLLRVVLYERVESLWTRQCVVETDKTRHPVPPTFDPATRCVHPNPLLSETLPTLTG